MSDTILVNKDKYIEYKAKSELYDKYIKAHAEMFNIRGGGIYRDFTNFIEILKTAKKGQLSIYMCVGGNLVIMPLEMYEKLIKKEDNK